MDTSTTIVLAVTVFAIGFVLWRMGVSRNITDDDTNQNEN